jgi:hypothetical protein
LTDGRGRCWRSTETGQITTFHYKTQIFYCFIVINSHKIKEQNLQII